MYIDNINELIDGGILDISKYCSSESCKKTLRINNSINEITLTSNSIPCNIDISVEERTTDLIIKINNLSINSNNIAFDLTKGRFCNYKVFMILSGNNTIASTSNIAICINNNHTIEFCGSRNSSLKILGGDYSPALGNTKLCAGNAHIIFSGTGNIDIFGGRITPDTFVEASNILAQSAGINISHKNNDEISSLSIKDSINLKIKGGDSLFSSQLSDNPQISYGSAGIAADYYTLIEKKSIGILDISGGSGDIGGPAILTKGAFIKIIEPSVLSSGHNNSTTNKEYSDIILFVTDETIKNIQKNKLFLSKNILINGKISTTPPYNFIASTELNNLLNLSKNASRSKIQEIVLNESKNNSTIKKLFKKIYRRLYG